MKLIFTNSTAEKIPKTLFTALLKELPKVLSESPQLEPQGVDHQEMSRQEVELLLTTNQAIQVLNKTYRGKDKPTDVLSFGLEDPNTLGQLVISVERAEEQAKELGQSLEEELRFLFAHGLLHLCGFDHEEPEEEKVMLAKTYRLLGRKSPS